MTEYANRNDSVSVGTTEFQLLPLRPEGQRIVYSIKNTSTGGQKITLAFGIDVTAISGKGVQLNPGESWVESVETTFQPTHEPVHIVSDNAGGLIAIYERIKIQ
jgi:hypothetical protein